MDKRRVDFEPAEKEHRKVWPKTGERAGER